jgi:dehydrogenase/reductase SDR family protein 12
LFESRAAGLWSASRLAAEAVKRAWPSPSGRRLVWATSFFHGFFSVLRAIASLAFYGRFLNSFSVIGYRRRSAGWRDEAWDFSGQRWVVTGASAGIGRALALIGVRHGAEVIAIARSQAALDALVRKASGPGRVIPLVRDLSVLSAIETVSSDPVLDGRPIDALVNNVGVLLNAFETTEEGLERSLAVNLLGHFVLTDALLRADRLAPDAVLVEVSSGGMYSAPLRIEEIFSPSSQAWDGVRAYALHKRAQVELVHAWNRRLAGARRAYVMHPGWVDTGGLKSSLPRFHATLNRLLRTPAEGADTIAWLLHARPEVPEKGGVWLDRKLEPEHYFALSRAADGDSEALFKRLESWKDRFAEP